MKLISMTTFVLEQNKILKTYVNHLRRPLFERCVNYANFLKQPLNLGMFFPCDEDGNVLKEPNPKEIYPAPTAEEEIDFLDCLEQYQQAKEKVLFEGIEFERISGVNFIKINEDTFAFHDFNIKFKNLTVEFLVQYNLQLTKSAIKQIGL